MSSTVNCARAAEGALVSAVNDTADAIASVGTGAVEAALGRLRAETAGLKARVEAARAAVAEELLGAARCLTELAEELEYGMALVRAVPPAPVATPAALPAPEPVPEPAPEQAAPVSAQPKAEALVEPAPVEAPAPAPEIAALAPERAPEGEGRGAGVEVPDDFGLAPGAAEATGAPTAPAVPPKKARGKAAKRAAARSRR